MSRAKRKEVRTIDTILYDVCLILNRQKTLFRFSYFMNERFTKHCRTRFIIILCKNVRLLVVVNPMFCAVRFRLTGAYIIIEINRKLVSQSNRTFHVEYIIYLSTYILVNNMRFVLGRQNRLIFDRKVGILFA